MNADPTAATSFDAVAGRVWKRVMLRRWLEQLRALAPWAVGILLLAVLLRFLGGAGIGAGVAWFGWIGWFGLAAVQCWRKRPGRYQAMALWDRSLGRREAFANAWWFEQKSERSEGESDHLEVEGEKLANAAGSLSQDLPLEGHRWHAAPCLALGAFLALGWVVSPDVTLWRVDDEMAAKAEEEARKLAEAELEKKDLEALSEEEKKALEELEKKIQDTAKELTESAGKDAKEVLRSLERRAREAEDLAKRLGEERDQWASDALVQELRRHADTADLGDAVAEKKAGRAADEAESLASQLKAEDLTEDTRERMNETLQDAAKKAEAADRKRVVGEHVLDASEALEQQKAQVAGEEFQKLADRMRDLERRQRTQDELEKLAEQLRQSGNNIAGQNEAGAMQEMAGSGEQQSGANGSDQGQSGETPKVGQAQSGMSQQSLMPPGMGQMNPQGGQGQQMQQSPVPGTGQSQNLPMLSQAPPGSGQGEKGSPMMMAPVPGSDPDKLPDAFMLGQGKPDGDPSMMMAIPGGPKPGVGTAELAAEATERIDNANQSMVTAQSNSEGQSTVRAVEGGVREEEAGRSATEVAVEFLSAQEEALDESALPPSRREQVRRYFTELRKRFEPSAR